MKSASSFVIYCEDDFSRCAWLAQGGANESIPLYMGCAFMAKLFPGKRQIAEVIIVCSVLRCFELCIFSAKIVLCLHHFRKLHYRTLDIETLFSPDSCFWWLLFEELQGTPYSFLLFSLLISLAGLFWILSCFNAHFNTQIVAELPSHSCQSKA